MHAQNPAAHFTVDEEEDGLMLIRKLLSFKPQNNLEEPQQTESDDPDGRFENDLNDIIPESANQPYDVKEVIIRVVDYGDFLEVHEAYARNIVVGFAKFDGMPVGIVANQPAYLSGVLDIESSRKAARFIRFCDAFNIPIVTFVDVPGFMPGSVQEYGGIIIHGALCLHMVRQTYRK
jgi:acetyl-CoA carboxylase carboxyltransferase component